MKAFRNAHFLKLLLLMGGWSGNVWLPALGGEKAVISVPNRKIPDAARPGTLPPPNTFQPFDPGSSVGGVVDPAAAPPSVPPVVPDARTQKEMFERVDRRKNWLLDDDSGRRRDTRTGGSQLLQFLEETDYTENPRKPQTALERRLKSTNRDPAQSDARDERGSRQADEEQWTLEADEMDATAPDSLGGRFGKNGLMPSWNEPSGTPMKYLGEGPTETPSVADLRLSTGSAAGRSTGLDVLSQERMERLQRTFGSDDLLDRTASLANSADQFRSRDLRSDFYGQTFGPAVPGSPLPGSTLAPEPTSLLAAPGRSSLSEPSALGIVANPYLGPPKAPEPHVSPAARMMRAAPVTPPRFRP
ncbi:MAG: hypothetical protein KF791_17625 [Verrucomicrobiae bacterium]|nr:hypothetical protein [Verrucomicrobiae bacterium]